MNETVIIHSLACISGYLLGSVPFGFVIAHLLGLGDLREMGSGNIGATNVLRTGNKLAAVLTVVLDVGKGAFAVALAVWLTSDPKIGLTSGIWAVMGHDFPVWLNFKGGKGVATTFGVLLATAWPVGLGAIATWLIVAFVSRYSSLASLLGLAAAPIFAWFLTSPQHALLAALLAAIVWARHHGNIRRLLNGTESKIGQKEKDP